jgi:putative flippase GtrA
MKVPEKYRELVRFAIVGVMSTLTTLVVYWIFLHWINPTLSYSIAYFCAFVLNYLLTTAFTFKVKRTWKNIIGFIISNIINYCVSVALLNIFLYIGVSSQLAPIPTLILATMSNFIVVRYVMKKK